MWWKKKFSPLLQSGEKKIFSPLKSQILQKFFTAKLTSSLLTLFLDSHSEILQVRTNLDIFMESTRSKSLQDLKRSSMFLIKVYKVSFCRDVYYSKSFVILFANFRLFIFIRMVICSNFIFILEFWLLIFLEKLRMVGFAVNLSNCVGFAFNAMKKKFSRGKFFSHRLSGERNFFAATSRMRWKKKFSPLKSQILQIFTALISTLMLYSQVKIRGPFKLIQWKYLRLTLNMVSANLENVTHKTWRQLGLTKLAYHKTNHIWSLTYHKRDHIWSLTYHKRDHIW